VDVWGLVVNEALASGIPVLASKYAGATQELVYNKDVGQVIDPVDIEGFSGILLVWCDKDLSKYKAITWEIIRPFNYKVTVDAFKSLINEYG
ncbi:MAG: glycosyltransferase, partial [Bacteroidetes bacterium]|nr:glycosyltransferase [Bacteroidota bacterium]